MENYAGKNPPYQLENASSQEDFKPSVMDYIRKYVALALLAGAPLIVACSPDKNESGLEKAIKDSMQNAPAPGLVMTIPENPYNPDRSLEKNYVTPEPATVPPARENYKETPQPRVSRQSATYDITPEPSRTLPPKRKDLKLPEPSELPPDSL